MIARPVAVYLALGPVDLRGAFDQLAAVTRKVLSLDPTSGALFLFLNRRRNRLKALWSGIATAIPFSTRDWRRGPSRFRPRSRRRARAFRLPRRSSRGSLSGLPIDEDATRRRIH